MSHGGKILYEKDNRKVIDCTRCGYAHVYPPHKQEELETYYSGQFYSERWPQYISKCEYEREYWIAIYTERLNKIEELLNHKGTILDIGSGPGLFLHAATVNGWDPYGVEPNDAAWRHSLMMEYAPNGQIARCTIQDYFPDTQLDAIHMSFLLEHIPQPEMILQKCHGLLKKDGIIVIEVPNDFSETQKIAEKVTNKSQWWISPLDHQNYFLPVSLFSLLRKNGFSVEYETGTFDMNLALIAGIDYVGNESIGRMIHHFRMELEKNLLKYNPQLKNKLYKAMYDSGVSREVIMYARKS